MRLKLQAGLIRDRRSLVSDELMHLKTSKGSTLSLISEQYWMPFHKTRRAAGVSRAHLIAVSQLSFE